MAITISIGLRYITLQACRTLGKLYYWLRTEWRPPFFWLLITTLVVCLPSYIDHVARAQARIWYQWLSILVTAWGSALSAQWVTVLAVYTILLLFWWAWQAKKRVVIEDFTDYTLNPQKADVKGLATLLVVQLAHLQELYRVVDEQRALSTEAKSSQPIDATIKVEDVSQFLSNAVSSQSKFSLGPLEIPVGTLLSLIGRLVQGPRILGSLHKNNDLLILTAQRVGDNAAYSWQVERKLHASATDQETYNLVDMIEELACRMFTDLALSGSVRWRATASFSKGLQYYRDCLRTPKGRSLKLTQAEKKFIETLGEDREFASANYNLGVLYMELGQIQAAEEAFLRAIGQNPGSWRGYYALTVCRCKLCQYQSVISLCDQIGERVITDKPGISNLAKIYHTKGVAQRLLLKQNSPLLPTMLQDIQAASREQRQDQPGEVESLQNQVDFRQRQNNILALNNAIQSYKKAVAFSLRAFCRAELKKEGVTKTENRVIPQREAVASICLIDLAIAYSEQAQEWSEIASYYGEQVKNYEELIKKDIKRTRYFRANQQIDSKYKLVAFRKAKVLFKRAGMLFYFATFLTASNTDTYLALVNKYGDNSYKLAKMYYEWGKCDEAIEQYTAALHINPQVAIYWASLALVYAEISRTQRITLPTIARVNKVQAKDACEKALSYLPTTDSDTLQDTLVNISKTHSILSEKSSYTLTPRTESNEARVRHLKDLVEYMDALLMKALLMEYNRINNTAGSGSMYAQQESAYTLEFLEKLLTSPTEEMQTGKRALAWLGAQIFLVLGRQALASARPKEAENLIKKAIELLKRSFPQEIQARELQGLLVYALLNQKKHDEALRAAEEALTYVPHSYFEREALGDAYFTWNRFNDAIEAWQDALLRRDAFMRKLPNLPRLDTSAMHFRIGASYLPKKDALDIHYKIGISYVEVARHLRDRSKRSTALRQAIIYLEQAQSLANGDIWHEKRAIHYYLGFLHFQLGEYENAISYLRIAKTSQYVRLTSLYYLGCAYLKNKDYEGALKQFTFLLDEASQLERPPHIGDQQGNNHQRPGLEEANQLEKPLQLNDLVEAEYVGFMYLGEILAMARWGIAYTNAERNTNLRKSLELIEAAQGYIDELLYLTCPVHFPADCLDCKGWILFKMGRIDDAISAFQRAISLSSDPSGYFHLALAHEKKLQTSKLDENLLQEIRICCQYVQEFDIKEEYALQVGEILKRLPFSSDSR